MTAPLIRTDELARILDTPDLRIVDATWRMDGSRPAPDAPRLPGAVRFDLDTVADQTSPLPHMLPAPSDFARAVGAMGVGDGDHIVVYDEAGLVSAARVWWTFRVMGARRVQVLDGGLPKWRAEGRSIQLGPSPDPPPARFTPRFEPGLVAGFTEVRSALGDPSMRVIDARAAARFRGEADEPRPGLRRGHMPGAANLPFQTLLNSDGTLRPPAELEAAFAQIGPEAGLAAGHGVITTCGSGVTAAVLSLALAVLGQGSAVYDGSWAEWGARPDAPTTTGV